MYVPNVAWGGGSPTKPNPGHTLADEVAAVYRALDMWGIEDNDLHVFTNDLQAIRTYGLLRLAQKPRLLTEVPKGVCFRKFISGWSLLGFMQETNPKFKPTAFPRSDLLRFRDYVWRRFGVVERPAPHLASVVILEKNVTLLSRGHASYIANTREIGVHLRDAYGVTVAYAAWETMTLKEQVHAATRWSLGGYVAVTWRLHGGYVAVTRRLRVAYVLPAACRSSAWRTPTCS